MFFVSEEKKKETLKILPNDNLKNLQRIKIRFTHNSKQVPLQYIFIPLMS